eukprot:CAMPEP_0176430762 /NCGR_PEP_ID=MMETSP0127-20121128/14433_1 /TAXON_ID=938130 /ORGANISM="Platyophrya macrostoma, Strain WH" /LENGTH=256 /DNA_ID=CAMNT_0017812687 /DNA_START=134 /DNA_END=905 /DNA_ORIENTATION=-
MEQPILKRHRPDAAGSGVCYRCNQGGHFSRECPNAPPSGPGGVPGPRACFTCNDPGHLSRDCPLMMQRYGYVPPVQGMLGGGGPRGSRGGGPVPGGCFKCGQPGHFSRECPNVAPTANTCFKCGQEGHMSRDCPNPAVDGAAGGRACYNCGGTGHLAATVLSLQQLVDARATTVVSRATSAESVQRSVPCFLLASVAEACLPLDATPVVNLGTCLAIAHKRHPEAKAVSNVVNLDTCHVSAQTDLECERRLPFKCN